MAGSTESQNTSENIFTKLRFALGQTRYLPKLADLVWQSSKKWTCIWIVFLVIEGLLPIAIVYLTKEIVDTGIPVIGKNLDIDAFKPFIFAVILLASVLLLNEVCRGILRWIREHQTEHIEDAISIKIHETSLKVDLAFYETPDYYDNLHRARDEAWYRPQLLVNNLGSLIQSGITLVAMAVVLIRFSFILPLVLLFSTAPALFILLKYAGQQYQWRIATTPDKRKAWYADHVITSRENAAEIRLFNLGDYFKNIYQNKRKILRDGKLRIIKRQSIAELGASLIALTAMAAALSWMGWKTYRSIFSIGELALFYSAFRQGQSMMRMLLENFGDIYHNILFLSDFFEFIELKSSLPESSESLISEGVLKSGIIFSNISFSYPGSSSPVFNNFDLNIDAGKITAIVGPNGSGKSTLLRLICRFYDPEQGTISFDGTDIKLFDSEKLHQMASVLFQQPVHYSAPVRENIAYGYLSAAPDLRAVKKAGKQAGADEFVQHLPLGYDTMLGKWFAGGTELSVGEWQRLALARAFLRDASIILLDEPTSAMDSWAEINWLKRLKPLVKGKTTLIITHRFTTAMQADIIHVIEGGKIIESGSHDELINNNGKYAESWKAQRNRS